MYKIGEFSILSKTTVKALRFYEKQGLLHPAYIDRITKYRYYDTSQLLDITKIISLRQIGVGIEDIRRVLSGAEDVKSVIRRQQEKVQKTIQDSIIIDSKIKFMLKENNMEREIVFKTLPECIVYYKEGVIDDFSKITDFVLSSADECLKLNPNIKCITPDYCYVNYLDGQYKENNIKIRYAQAVEDIGVENDSIKFSKIDQTRAVCIYHRGSYATLRESYSAIMNYIESNNLKIIDFPRECYIDGVWNKDNEDDYLTEIQVPVVSK